MPTPSTLLKVGDRCKILKTRGKPPAWINSLAVVAEISENGKTVRADIENQPGLRYTFNLDWLERLPSESPQPEPQNKVEDNEKTDNPAEAPKPPAPVTKFTEPAQEPYLFSQCTITVAIQLLPDDGSGDRSVIIGVRNHTDAPILKLVRQSQQGELPPVIADLLQELKTDLPRRAEAQKTRAKRSTAKPASQANPQVQRGAGPVTPVHPPKQTAPPTSTLENAVKQTQMTLFDALTPGG